MGDLEAEPFDLRLVWMHKVRVVLLQQPEEAVVGDGEQVAKKLGILKVLWVERAVGRGRLFVLILLMLLLMVVERLRCLEGCR